MGSAGRKGGEGVVGEKGGEGREERERSKEGREGKEGRRERRDRRDRRDRKGWEGERRGFAVGRHAYPNHYLPPPQHTHITLYHLCNSDHRNPMMSFVLPLSMML